MSKGPEAKFRDNKIRPFLDSLERCYWFIKEAKALRGIPDLIGCLNGRFFAIEVKAKKSGALAKGRAALQGLIIKQINKAGGVAFFTSPETWEDDKCKLLEETHATIMENGDNRGSHSRFSSVRQYLDSSYTRETVDQ